MQDVLSIKTLIQETTAGQSMVTHEAGAVSQVIAFRLNEPVFPQVLRPGRELLLR
ncbi:hypothetical protein SAMN05192553_101616 [Cyclobacterium xiamenense]|uniref:Uncharacterized protein n=2 Tax=Cyclobacterium xiamenense TaxID=1297121 RepID=A0A1H6U3I2_9BACT|nr:hypothetical protein SAMN05192553_101616 [Cyclobacterium xiamenense]